MPRPHRAASATDYNKLTLTNLSADNGDVQATYIFAFRDRALIAYEKGQESNLSLFSNIDHVDVLLFALAETNTSDVLDTLTRFAGRSLSCQKV